MNYQIWILPVAEADTHELLVGYVEDEIRESLQLPASKVWDVAFEGESKRAGEWVSARVVDRRFEPVDKGPCRIGSGLVAVVGDRSVDVSCGLGAQADVHLCTKTGD